MDLPPDVRDDIERLNRLLGAQRVLVAKLEAVAEMAQRAVPGCDSVSIALIVEESAFTGASSSQMAIEADMVQYRSGEGPCLDAADRASTVRIDALGADERYEHFAPGALEVGVESVFSIPLVAGEVVVGSVNLYSGRPDAFSEDTAASLAPLSDYAVELIRASPFYEATVSTLERLLEVVDDAAQVEIAVGLLIVRRDMSPAQAWEHLIDLATAEGCSIVTCARRLVEDHERRRPDPHEEPQAKE